MSVLSVALNCVKTLNTLTERSSELTLILIIRFSLIICKNGLDIKETSSLLVWALGVMAVQSHRSLYQGKADKRAPWLAAHLI